MYTIHDIADDSCATTAKPDLRVFDHDGEQATFAEFVDADNDPDDLAEIDALAVGEVAWLGHSRVERMA